ncbi:MAG: hypothetical protein ACXVAX_01745 [Pseudobdellovibrio sp.]
MKKSIIAILLFSISTITQAGESFVPLQKGVRMASDDLIYGDNVLTSREAQDLSQLRSVDLSLLQPKSNEIWSQEESMLDDQQIIELKDNETLTFEGALTSNTGLYRFNAIPENGSKIYTIHLDKTLHTLLLRKNLLRKLGYKIPAIKYLKKVFIMKMLSENQVPPVKVDLATVKPVGLMPYQESVDEFKFFISDDYKKFLLEIKDKSSTLTLDHPWFGAFNAQQWFWLLSMHQAVHLKQIREIKKRLPVLE